MKGSGLFSGEKGGIEKKPKVQLVSATLATKSIDNMGLDETSKVPSDRIRQLQCNHKELELLKREINKKLQQ